MTNTEFRELQHGDKICGPDGLNFIVHNNHRSGLGMVVAVRTQVIHGRFCGEWSIVRIHKPVKMVLAEGTYQVQIVGKI